MSSVRQSSPTLLRLAARNLQRNLRRTLITTAAISLGLALIVLTVNLNEGGYKRMMHSAISAQAGHIVVQAAGYQADPDPLLLIDRAAEVVAKAEARFPEGVVAARSRLAGLITSPNNAVGAGVLAIVPSREREITDLHTKLTEGAWLQDDDDRGVILGAELARRLGVAIGEKVVLMGQGETEVTSRLLRLRGVLRTGSLEMDANIAVVTLGCAQAFLERPDSANQISVQLGSTEGTRALAAALVDDLQRPDLEVLDWEQALPEIVELIQVDRTNNVVTMSIVGFIVAIGVLNTISMSVMERIREFGVLLALGLRPSQIASIIVMEGLLLGFGSSLIGLCIGIAISYPLVRWGFDAAAMMGSESMEVAGVMLDSRIFGAWAVPEMLIWTAAAWGMTILSTLWPARTASTLEPVDAMRHV